MAGHRVGSVGASSVRILVLHRRFDSHRAELDMLGAFSAVADLAEWTESVETDSYDAVVLFVPFRELLVSPPIDWKGFDGLRVMLDHDACQNYWSVDEHARFLGRWPEVVRRHQIDLLIVSGQLLAQRFELDGVRSAWLPKACEVTRFRDLGLAREGIVHYGSPRRARAAMLDHVRRARFTVTELSSDYVDLPRALNRSAACLICNAAGGVPFGRLGRAINTLRPFVRIGPSMEPMLKNFEAAACGSAVFTDEHPDLAALGFVDGRTVVTYSEFDELTEKLRWYQHDTEGLSAIARAGAELVNDRHSWHHRAVELTSILERFA